MTITCWFICWILIFLFFITLKLVNVKLNIHGCIGDKLLYKFKHNALNTALILVMLFTLCFICYFANHMNISNHFSQVGSPLSLDESGNINIIYQYSSSIGSILAALFTGLSAFLLWVTLLAQRKQNEKQAIENHFYTMLKIARDNSESMRSKGKKGRYVFKQVCDDFDEVYKIIDNYCESYHGKERQPSKSERISISWLIVFYGLDDKNISTLKLEISKISKLISSEDTILVKEIEELISNHREQKQKNKSSAYQEIKLKPNGFYIYKKTQKKWLKFDGYQSILAHYFRHLFQTVEYINKKSILRYDEKYHYIRTLRAQLNTFELIVLFYNTLSPYGKDWEPYLHHLNSYNPPVDNFLGYSDSIKTVRDDRNELVNYDEYINKQLITKYQFFRNITMPLGNNLEVKDFFPMIEYEHLYNTERDKLVAIYSKQDK